MPQNGSVCICFGLHNSRSDALALRPYLDACDIYIPEVANWDPMFLRAYQAVSDGRLSAKRAAQTIRGNYNDFAKGELAILSGTSKRILLADWPFDHPQIARFGEVYRQVCILPPDSMSFRDAVAAANADLAEYARLQTERELFIADRITEIAHASPEHRIFVRIGVGHTNLARLLDTRGVPTQRFFQHPYNVFSVVEQVTRLESFRMQIPADAGARWLLETLINTILVNRGAGLSTRLQRKAIAQIVRMSRVLTYEQIGELWERCRRTDRPDRVLRSSLSEFGSPWPEKETA